MFKKKEGVLEVEASRFKARLVAKGYTQKEGVDFNEIFSPVVRHTSIRILLSLVVHKGLELHQLDIKTAFLHGDLEEEIYMAQPEGYARGVKVCLLQKSLYGLKQSPRQWYKKFDMFMLGIGFKRSTFDLCVYYKGLSNGEFIYLLLYVDDMLIACKHMDEIDNLKKLMSSKFEMKDLGEAKKILEIDIFRDKEKREIFVSQRKYIEKVLERFNMGGANPVITPLAPHFKLSSKQCPKSEQERESMAKMPYASAVGCIMYLMVCTRPDIAHAVSVVSRFMSNPGKPHWEALRWILRYLKGSMDVGLLYRKENNGNGDCVVGYCDADLGGDRDKRKSLTGYIFSAWGNTISWRASLQPVVALSSTEAEYMAATEATREALWLKWLVNELGVPQNQVIVHCDN